jgi:hypothetical protein
MVSTLKEAFRVREEKIEMKRKKAPKEHFFGQ